LNQLFKAPLAASTLHELAASLGSDVPFFLQSKPALATGRGEVITPLDFFPALEGTALLLIHPGFGIASSWAYQQLANFPDARNGRPGRAKELIGLLSAGDMKAAGKALYNSLEAPALHKHPILQLYQEFLRENGAMATLMSGSGSTTFAIVQSVAAAEKLAEAFRGKFGTSSWMAVVAV
jgi:4-diphosphocytidyl-2-C-methyl-D-erythritol kinase